MNKQLVDTLSQLNTITNTLILKHPITVAASEAKDIYVYLDVSEIDVNTFPNIGLNNNLSNYLNLFKLFAVSIKFTSEFCFRFNKVFRFSAVWVSKSTVNLALSRISFTFFASRIEPFLFKPKDKSNFKVSKIFWFLTRILKKL